MPRPHPHRPRPRLRRPWTATGLAGLLVLSALVAPAVHGNDPGAGARAENVGWQSWAGSRWHRRHRPAPTPPPAPGTATPAPGPATSAPGTATSAPGTATSAPDPSAPAASPPGTPGAGGTTGTSAPPTTGGGVLGTGVNPYVPVDAARIPAGSIGSDQRLLRAGGQRGESENGEFRTVCTYSHMAFDDPIVKPGQPGASHLHAFFGNTAADAWSTAASIRDSGRSTCRGGILNRSAYWVPELVDVGDRTPLTPSHIDGYYKNGFGGVPAGQIHPLPQGLRMIAGDAMATAPQSRQVGQWGCDDGTSRPYRFWGHVPDYCAGGDVVSFEVDFPQCWDGRNLDFADHRSHMAYTLDGARGCPATHPVAIPAISIVVHWPLPAGVTAKDLRLSSDMYPTSSPGGYSWHGDWFGGWDEATMQSWVKNCNNAGKNCFSDLIADGKSLYGER